MYSSISSYVALTTTPVHYRAKRGTLPKFIVIKFVQLSPGKFHVTIFLAKMTLVREIPGRFLESFFH